MEKKPGFKTSEFWLSLAAVAVNAAIASEAFAPSSPALKILAMISGLLVAMGYGGARFALKKEQAAAEVIKAALDAEKK
jgi:hypothetical protein